ncbi:MAG TPA: prolyl oligopeptidase family serine peptidase [Bryobacteraceae bacterium]|nr:prolyl oligopeptidase family serine peptidase [Bryobacteraceae bacterium]
MKWLSTLLAAAALTAAPAYTPTQSEIDQIRTKLADLNKTIDQLHSRHADEALAADVEVYKKAADYILRFRDEFYTQAYVNNTLSALHTGIARGKELLAGSPSWPAAKGRLVRAYRSRVDGSIQPYGMIVPESYDDARPMRLDVILHGRGATLNEVSFIAAHDSQKPIPREQNYLQLEVFGRGNNAYRWSGETDVFEAIDSVRARYKIDPNRIVLRGFSMGGAGAWHLGLHYPSDWAAVEAGAGFTETKHYAHRENLPPYQEATLHIYDAVDYALNVFDVPFVGYGGEDDPQLQASLNIRRQLTREGFKPGDLRDLFLVGPHTKHKFHPDSKAESDKFINAVLEQGRQSPNHIRFVTYTTRYNRCFWIEIETLENHYQRAEVEARREGNGFRVHATNVTRLLVEGKPWTQSPDGTWAPTTNVDRHARQTLQKVHGLQGPIDDAFMDSFLCVPPASISRYPVVNDHARKVLDQFAAAYAKYFRGDIRIKDDRAVTNRDIASNNLILFGDPSSNRIIARIASKLPIQWKGSDIIAGQHKYTATDHMPVLIYPNPLNPKRYVVLNSGHTFGEADLIGTNALLYPRLGDYAVIDLSKPDGHVAEAGLFTETWTLRQ